MKKIKQLKCVRCGYEWWPRYPFSPRLCPGCKGFWDVPRKRKPYRKEEVSL